MLQYNSALYSTMPAGSSGKKMDLLLATSIFIASSALITFICRRNLRFTQSHGFYRYFAFLSVAALMCLNAPFWFVDKFSLQQLASWSLLAVSASLVILGVMHLRQSKPRHDTKQAPGNFAFENTGELITTGIYRFIRHPMYASLLLLIWGVWLKHTSVAASLTCLLGTLALWLAATTEERENVVVFGDDYRRYAEHTPRFFPFLF